MLPAVLNFSGLEYRVAVAGLKILLEMSFYLNLPISLHVFKYQDEDLFYNAFITNVLSTCSVYSIPVIVKKNK